jgi:hypothetical protein
MTEKRDFEEKYIFGKSHFEDEERLRERRDEEKIREQRKNAGQIHIYEVSLRRRRETSGMGRILERRENTGQIHIVKSHFEDEERLRRNILRGRRETSRNRERVRKSLIH